MELGSLAFWISASLISGLVGKGRKPLGFKGILV